MEDNKIIEYRYMDEIFKKKREFVLKDFLINNNTECLSFYDLDMYDNPQTVSSKILSVVNKSLIEPKIVLNKYQIEILNILNDSNLFLSAPTSFGKTFIMLEFIKRNEEKLKNIIFIIPTLALMNELVKKIYKLFSEGYNICINGSEELKEKNIFVFVPERSDKEFLTRIKELEIDLLVFDEIYKLQPKSNSEIKTDDRIIYMNKVYLDLVKKSNKIALLGPYINSVSFQRTKLDIVKYYTNFLPVYNNVIVLKDNESWTNYIKLEHQLIYFSSPGSIYNNLEKILEIIPENEDYIRKYSLEIEYLENKVSKDWYVIALLKRGIGIHHGKTPMFLRKFYENEYNSGNIKILLCTNTLMEGINTPTNSLIVVDDPGTAFKLNNLIGRVGRLNVESPSIGEVILSNSSILDNLKNTNDWCDLKILAESDEIVSDDEIIYLDKEYKQEDKKEKINEELKILTDYNITVDDIVYQNLQLEKSFNYINGKLYDEFANGKNMHDFVVSGTKLIKAPGYIFKKDRYEDLFYQNETLPYKYYICDLLKNYSYKNLVDYFNRNYNKTNNLKNTNIFIDSLYELNNYIKFKFSKLVQYLKIYESDEMKNNSELQKFIGILSSYKNFDTANKILDDLGINEEDFMKIIELLNISNVISTSIIIKLIKQNKDYLLTQDLTPFTKNNIKNI